METQLKYYVAKARVWPYNDRRGGKGWRRERLCDV